MITMVETKRIKCAHCKDYHGSIPEVKACAAGHNAAKVFGVQEALPLPVPPARPAYVTLRENAKKDAVKSGHYALQTSDGWKFYRVTRKTEGRWAGRVFVDVQAGDEYFPTYSREHRESILGQIAQDPKAAMLNYGRQIGRCGHCGRTLTNPASINYGIGPVCAGRMGW